MRACVSIDISAPYSFGSSVTASFFASNFLENFPASCAPCALSISRVATLSNLRAFHFDIPSETRIALP